MKKNIFDLFMKADEETIQELTAYFMYLDGYSSYKGIKLYPKKIDEMLNKLKQDPKAIRYIEFHKKQQRYGDLFTNAFRTFQFFSLVLLEKLTFYETQKKKEEELTVIFRKLRKTMKVPEAKKILRESLSGKGLKYKVSFKAVRDKIVLNDNLKGGISEEIEEARKMVQEIMAVVKAFATALEDFIKEEGLCLYMPMKIQSIYNDLEDSIFYRNVIDDERYYTPKEFAAEVVQEVLNIEPFKYQGIFPSYWSAEPDKETYNGCIDALKNIL